MSSWKGVVWICGIGAAVGMCLNLFCLLNMGDWASGYDRAHFWISVLLSTGMHFAGKLLGVRGRTSGRLLLVAGWCFLAAWLMTVGFVVAAFVPGTGLAGRRPWDVVGVALSVVMMSAGLLALRHYARRHAGQTRIAQGTNLRGAGTKDLE